MDTIKHHAKLSAQERDLIAVWKGGGISLRKIARKLDRSHSTIIEEVKRNSFHDDKGNYYYVSIWAQSQTQKRIKKARERQPLKNPEIYSYVLDKLRQGWSPEQIAGRLRKIYGKTIICHETIYQFIYAINNQHKNLWEYLPWKRLKRKPKNGRKVHRGKIPDRVSIHQRPELINTRKQFGHWEADTLEGKGHQEGIHTEVERTTRFLKAMKVNRINSQQTIIVQKQLFESLPDFARKSVTMDNGRENHCHVQLKSLGINTYFADPYSSWQRGTNEFHNGLLRRYLPKKSSFKNLNKEEIDDIVWEINNKPRKVLNYNTPVEVFNSYLAGRILS